jgi:hypothetical protein
MRYPAWTLLLTFVCAIALCLALGFGLLALVAFLDARLRCPGNQCSDAIGTTGVGVVPATLSLVAAGLAARRLAAARAR